MNEFCNENELIFLSIFFMLIFFVNRGLLKMTERKRDAVQEQIER